MIAITEILVATYTIWKGYIIMDWLPKILKWYFFYTRSWSFKYYAYRATKTVELFIWVLCFRWLTAEVYIVWHSRFSEQFCWTCHSSGTWHCQWVTYQKNCLCKDCSVWRDWQHDYELKFEECGRRLSLFQIIAQVGSCWLPYADAQIQS